MPKTKTKTNAPDTTSPSSSPAPSGGLVDPITDDLDGVGDFLTSLNNYEELDSAMYSVPGTYALKQQASDPTLSKKQQKKAKQQYFKHVSKKVRPVVGDTVNRLAKDGSIGGGDVRGTYQSSHDTGKDFGGETAMRGVYGDEFVLHGHYNGDGTAKSGSMGVKLASDPMGPRLAHGVDDALASDPKALVDNFTGSSKPKSAST